MFGSSQQPKVRTYGERNLNLIYKTFFVSVLLKQQSYNVGLDRSLANTLRFAPSAVRT